MPQENEEELCNCCNGSGEGMTSDSACYVCRGTGVAQNADD